SSPEKCFLPFEISRQVMHETNAQAPLLQEECGSSSPTPPPLRFRGGGRGRGDRTVSERVSDVRLTLRTLLAYLDDQLEPAEIKRIGQKVAESDAAQELIARIKQVTRRRRLTTPTDGGAGERFDANIGAAYLDSELPAEQ